MRKELRIMLMLFLIAAVTALTACGSPPAGSTTSTAAPVAPSTSTTSADYGPTGHIATDTSYKSATKTINITTKTAGSGSSKMVFYVADIRLKQGTDLQSVFSNGAYRGKAQETSVIAKANEALVAVNGDYYRARSDGVVIRNGVLYRDVPARTGLAIYKNGTMKAYDEKTTTGEKLLAEGVWNTFSFGPVLLEDRSIAPGLDVYEANPNPELSIQGEVPRTGVGMFDVNHFVFVVVDRSDVSKGASLREFAQIFQDLGCTTAYNLDGGGSSTMYFMGKVVNDPSAKSGQRIVSDILFVR